MKKHGFTRFLSMLLCAVMVLGSAGVTAYAENPLAERVAEILRNRMPAQTETEEEPAAEPEAPVTEPEAPAAEPETPAAEPAAPAEESEPAAEQGPVWTVRAELVNKGTVKPGTLLIYQAKVEGDASKVKVVWQVEEKPDEWKTIAKGAHMMLNATASALSKNYRVALLNAAGQVVAESAVELPTLYGQEEPADEEPVGEEPASEEAMEEEPTAEEPATEEPIAEEPTAEEPAAEEPIAEEPTSEEPVAEEPAAEEPVAEDPAAEEPAAEEPAAEEPASEEPAVEEPAAEEIPSVMIRLSGDLANGSVTVSGKSVVQLNGSMYMAAPGSKVTVQANPAEGYALSGLKVTGIVPPFKAVEVSNGSFTMPAKPVVVKAAFEAAEEPAAEPAEEPVEEPTEEPVEEQAGEPAEESEEKPAEEPAEETEEEPAEEPTEESEEEPAEDSEEEPAEESEEEPAEASEEEDEEGSVEALEGEETGEEEPDGAGVILTQPANQAANNGAMVSFTVSAVSGAVVQWQVDRGDDKGFVNLANNSAWSGTDTDTLTFKAIPAREPFRFRAAVTANGTTVHSKAVTFDLIPVITAQPVNQTAEYNQTVRFTVQVQYAESCRWQVDRQDGKGFVNLSDNSAWSGTTTDTLSFTAIAARAPYKFRALAINGISSTPSAEVGFAILPVINLQPEDQYAALNEMVTFHAGVQNAESVRWQVDRQDGKGFVDLAENSAWSGTATDTLTFKAIAARLPFAFRIVCRNGFVETASGAVRFYLKPVFDQQPANQVAALNTTVTFTAHAKDAESYQWQVDRGDGNGFVDLAENSAWSGTRTGSLSFKAIAARKPFVFRVVAGNNGGLCRTESNPVTWDVPAILPEIITQPSDQEAENNAMVTFAVAADHADSYQWQADRKDGLGFVNLKENSVWMGTKTNTLTFKAIPAREPYTFRVVVSNSAGSAASDPCVFTIPVPAEPPQITSQPADQLVRLNDTVSFTAGVQNADSLCWQVDRQDGNGFVNLSDNSAWSGTKTETLSFKAIEARRSFRFRLKAVNNGGETVSAAVQFDLIRNQTVTVTADQTAVINGQPVHLTASVENAQGPVSYLWQTKKADVSVWETAYENTNEAVLTTQGSYFIDQLLFRCAVTDNAGTWYSNPISFIYIPPELSVTANTEIVSPGTRVTLTAWTAYFSSGATYQWQRCATEDGEWQTISSAKSASYSFLVLTSAQTGYYRCLVNDIYVTWPSNTVRVRFASAPVFTLQPVSQQAMANQPVVFTARAEDAAAYQWQADCRNGAGFVNLTDGDGWMGTATDTLSFPASGDTENYRFRLKASNTYGARYSDTVTYTLLPEPTVTVTAEPASAINGQPVSLTADVQNAQGTVSCEWQRKEKSANEWDTDPNDTGTLVMSFLASYDLAVYEYRCAVTDSSGTWHSNAVSIDYVYPSLSISANTTSGTSGTLIILTAAASNFSSDASYLWQYSADQENWTDKSTSKSTYSFTLTDSASGYYRLKITDTNGWFWISNTIGTTMTREPIYRALLLGVNNCLRWTDDPKDIPSGAPSYYCKGYTYPYFYVDVTGRNVGDTNLMRTMLNGVYGGKTGDARYQVTTKIDPTYEDVRSLIQSTFTDTTDDDVSLFFIATHGAYGGDGDLELAFTGSLTSGTDEEIEAAIDHYVDDQYEGLNDLPFATLASWLNQYVRGDVIVILESCGAGSAIYYSDGEQNGVIRPRSLDGEAASQAFVSRAVSVFAGMDPGVPVPDDDGLDAKSTGDLRKNRYYVLAAARHHEMSWGSEYYGYNYFTKWLTEGVGSSGNMPADSSGNGILTLTELFSYIQQYDTYSFADGAHQHVQRYPAGSDYALFR